VTAKDADFIATMTVPTPSTLLWASTREVHVDQLAQLIDHVETKGCQRKKKRLPAELFFSTECAVTLHKQRVRQFNSNVHTLVGKQRGQSHKVIAVQKVLSGSGRTGRLRLMGKYIGHRLVARPELDNTFWTDST